MEKGSLNDRLYDFKTPAHDGRVSDHYLIRTETAAGCCWPAGLAGNTAALDSSCKRHGSVGRGHRTVVRGGLRIKYTGLADCQDRLVGGLYCGGGFWFLSPVFPTGLVGFCPFFLGVGGG